ncbi:alpha/beta hydrolase [Rhizobium mongolense]|uniref:alpha/beta hydrolase n=1 Tax=Rhizobium mongolense TaxID=57676 RepID=UPI0035580646
MSEATAISEPKFLTVGEGDAERKIAFIIRQATSNDRGPTFVWLSGYRSDMSGTKAIELDRLAGELGLACIRLDYSGHGLSSGEFKDGTISRWLEEALAVLLHARPERVIIVGSSMGGWIALRLAQELAKLEGTPKLDGMVLIAPAPDFTSDLIEPHLRKKDRASLAERGFFEEKSDYSPEPNIYTRALLEDGRQNRVLTGIINTGCPVHVVQGMKDPDVPYSHAMKLVEHLPADNVVLTFIRDGDHRLSRPQDIERILSAAKGLIR